ncbi:hypothetical protein RB594_002313 [Gaeumannomyces avenae]
MLERGRHGSRVKMSTTAAAIRPDVLSLLLSLWASAPTLVRAADASATAPEAAAANKFVPTCAGGCYQAFIENNRFLDACGASPSLECLCVRYGSTGATFGEGAVQCMAAEMNGGHCTGDQVPDAHVYTNDLLSSFLEDYFANEKLFEVFFDDGLDKSLDDALENFFDDLLGNFFDGTLENSFDDLLGNFFDGSLGSFFDDFLGNFFDYLLRNFFDDFLDDILGITTILVELCINLLIDFLRNSLDNILQETSTSEETPTPNPSSNTSQTGTGTAVPGTTSSVAPVAVPSGMARLSGGQVAGITVGAVSGVFLLLALAFLARRRRRDPLQNGENGARSSFYDNRGGPSGGGGGVAGAFARLRDSLSRAGSKKTNSQDGSRPQSMQISRPMGVGGGTEDAWAPRPYETIVGGTQPRADVNIGLAFSPDIVAGRFQPAGPLYASAAIPAAAATANRQSLQFTPPQHEHGQFSRGWEGSPSGSIRPTLTLAIPPSRDSDVTEFAEDGEEDADADGAQIWRPPPGDPHSATTYYVADRSGNWRRRSTLKGGNAPRPEGANGVEVASAAVAPLNVPQRLGSPINMGRTGKGLSTMSTTSSVYSPNTPPQSKLSDPANSIPPMPPFPKSAYAKMLAMNNDLSAQPGAVAKLPPASPERKNSPVSPGVSPVSYPTIPRRDIRRSMTPEQRQLHQQQQPKPLRSPAGQPSPTLGATPEPVKLGRSLTGSGPRANNPGAGYGGLAGWKSPAAADYANPYSDIGSSSPYTASRSGSSNRNHPRSPDSFNTLGSLGAAQPGKLAGAEKANDDGFMGARSQWRHDQPQPKLGVTTVELPSNKDHTHLPATPGWEPKLTPTRRGADLFLKVG